MCLEVAFVWTQWRSARTVVTVRAPLAFFFLSGALPATNSQKIKSVVLLHRRTRFDGVWRCVKARGSHMLEHSEHQGHTRTKTTGGLKNWARALVTLEGKEGQSLLILEGKEGIPL